MAEKFTSEFLEALNSVVMAVATKQARNVNEATELAEAIEELLRIEYGGRVFYLHSQDISRRNERLMADFNGKNRDEVCKKYGITASRFYQILSE